MLAYPKDNANTQTAHQKSLLVEGWRGINHSFALVNQSQILALLDLGFLKIYHNDLPFAFPHWNRISNKSGLSPQNQQRVDTLEPAPSNIPINCVYRICAPFRTAENTSRHKTITFMVTELGLSTRSFHEQSVLSDFTRDGNSIVTPSNWSRDRLIEWGFPENKVSVISHGVDGTIFHPLTTDERRFNRAALGIEDDMTVFLNVGLPSWNKGIDILIVSFAKLRRQGYKVRLILKDQKELYGLSVLDMIKDLAAVHPELNHHDTIAAISIISNNLSREDLRLFYGIADCYVSPYRAEGFNLPVLEAIACGTPVIVTKGGSTDDFCNDQVAIRVNGTQSGIEDSNTGLKGRYIEPDPTELLEAMTGFTGNRSSILPDFDVIRAFIADRFSWQDAARQVARITVGYDAFPTGKVLDERFVSDGVTQGLAAKYVPHMAVASGF